MPGHFPCPSCDKADCPVHDTSMQEWWHLDFFQAPPLAKSISKSRRFLPASNLHAFTIHGGTRARASCIRPVSCMVSLPSPRLACVSYGFWVFGRRASDQGKLCCDNDFESVEGCKVVAGFDGGRITSDAGAVLLSSTDKAIGLIERFAWLLSRRS